MIHGIGIDAVEVPRFKRAMEKWGERLTSRLFTGSELAYSLRLRRPERHLAARFAAKVSFFKALGKPVPWRDVEVVRASSGAPALSVKGLSEGMRVSVSISHDGDLSIAETIIERDS
ncbi:MAG: holo-ACP synthase [Deltaproteobacteria bacterium]|nr:holo-ACP synthase [Deltaproteobacteria bacterium]MBZ0220004.1 holo-ACP synthase [Deltaproteobacteria bacterium]